MCHLLLLLPLVALPVFWLLPWTVAVPTYAAVVAFSGWLYWLAWRAMRRPVVTGQEQLIGSTGEVLKAGSQPLQVRVGGETWDAVCTDRVHKGDQIQVLAIDGLTLHVRLSGAAEPSQRTTPQLSHDMTKSRPARPP